MKILLLNQCFYPDVVSTAQYLTDLAVELADCGHEVTVIAGDRGYDDGARRFTKREIWKGIRIIRLPSLALGKKARWRRALNFASFSSVCAVHLLFMRKFDVVVALTSPPLISLLGSLFVRLKGGRFFFWVMDLNPDESVAAGWLKESSLVTRILGALLRYSLRQAEKVIVLDRFMSQRILDKGIAMDKVTVIPPWSHNDQVTYDPAGRLAFRAAHGLEGKYVVMYSGNHSPCHSLDTLLGAAGKLAGHSVVAFCFVGGGSEYVKVQAYAREHKLRNILCLPYQPLNRLAGSLSAADLHVVVMGDAFTGIVHPCKIYNILEIGSPVLYIGPAQSHVVEVLSQLEDQSLVCSVRHGDIDEVANYIISGAEKTTRRRLPSAITVSFAYSRESLLPKIIELIECVPSGRFSPRPVVSETEGQSLL